MKLTATIFLLTALFFSCSEDIAEDGSERGKLSSVNEFETGGGKQFAILYNRTEETNSPDQATIYSYYWMAYTLDSKTGKLISQNKYDAEETFFLGTKYGFSFMLAENQLALIDYQKNKWINPAETATLLFNKNPGLRNQIAKTYLDLYNHIVFETKTGDIYLLNLKTLSVVIKGQENSSPEFEFERADGLLGEVKLLNNFYNGIAIDDLKTLVVTTLDPENDHKRYISVCTENSPEIRAQIHEVYNLQKYDSTVFLDGNLIGLKDNIAYISCKTALGETGKTVLMAYDWKSHYKIWEIDPLKLFDSKKTSQYDITWKNDGSAFFIHPLSNEFIPFSYVDSRTGKLIWKF